MAWIIAALFGGRSFVQQIAVAVSLICGASLGYNAGVFVEQWRMGSAKAAMATADEYRAELSKYAATLAVQATSEEARNDAIAAKLTQCTASPGAARIRGGRGRGDARAVGHRSRRVVIGARWMRGLAELR